MEYQYGNKIIRDLLFGDLNQWVDVERSDEVQSQNVVFDLLDP